MITKRIIPCLDVRNGRVVKGTNFEGIKDVADPVEMARLYNAAGADELVFYDITASFEGRALFTEILTKVASEIFIPDAAKSSGADLIIAIGGGSPMDTAKAIALLAAQDIPRDKLFSGNYTKDILPTVFVPTTAGTGSEVTQYSILTDDAAKTKKTIASPEMFPDLADRKSVV